VRGVNQERAADADEKHNRKCDHGQQTRVHIPIIILATRRPISTEKLVPRSQG
jgi:hypothetical protein